MINPTKQSEAGELWKPFYQNQKLSWCEPEKITLGYLNRWMKSEWITRLLWYAMLKPNAKILEAVCGTGLYATTMEFKGFSVEAFDYNEEALDIDENFLAKMKKEIPTAAVHFFKSNILKTDLPANEYDFVFNQAVLEYFCDDTERKSAIREMVRMTKPGGRVAVIVQHTDHPMLKIWTAMGWPGYINQPPVISWSPEKLRRELLNAGLMEIKISGLQPW